MSKPAYTKGGIVIDPDQLGYCYNHRSYTITYKGHDIPGGAVHPDKKVRNTEGARKFFRDQGRVERNNILAGRGRPDILEGIEKVELTK